MNHPLLLLAFMSSLPYSTVLNVLLGRGTKGSAVQTERRFWRWDLLATNHSCCLSPCLDEHNFRLNPSAQATGCGTWDGCSRTHITRLELHWQGILVWLLSIWAELGLIPSCERSTSLSGSTSTHVLGYFLQWQWSLSSWTLISLVILCYFLLLNFIS